MLKHNGSILDVEVSLNTIEVEGKTLIQSIFRDITERKRIQEINEKMAILKDSLISSTILITERLDLETIGKETLYTAIRLIKAESGIFVHVEECELTNFVYKGLSDKDVKSIKKWIGENINPDIFIQKKTIICPDISKDNRFAALQNLIPGIKSFLGTPIIFDEQLMGIIVLFNKFYIHESEKQDQEILDTLSIHSATAINNARLYNEIMSINVRLEGKIWERTKELEDALKEAEIANQAKSSFLTNISHELRTPLNAIIGFSDVLKEQYYGNLNEKQNEYINDILESGKHLLNLINDILDLSKVATGKMELELTPIHINDIIESSLIMIKEKSLKHNISLDIEIPEEIKNITIMADERKLKQVMFNLLSNASKFTQDNGSIRVQVEKDEDNLIISVIDSGIGIPQEYQIDIFNKFYQARNDIPNKTSGTGLGLSLCRQFVNMHGGDIWVESEGSGHGSCFTFTIPLTLGQKIPGNTISKKTILENIERIINQSTRHNRCFSICSFQTPNNNSEDRSVDIFNLIKKEKRDYDFLAIDINKVVFLILTEIDKKNAELVCHRLKEKMINLFDDLPIIYSIASFPEDGESPELLFQKVQQYTISFNRFN